MSVTQRYRHERGASAITVAITMVVIMGMAAIAIDVGAGFVERRHDQTGGDTGVMAGAVELALGGSTQDVVDQVLAFVDSNVRPVPLADWVSCNDSDALILTAADLGLTPATDCISFHTFQRLRVRVPDQDVDTTFGRVLGVDTLTTSAAAEALIFQFPGFGNSPPFVALSGSAGGDQVCLRTGPSSLVIPPMMIGNGPGLPATLGTLPDDADPCDETVYDPDSQFFGALDPYTYFNNQTGAVTCKQNLTDYAIAAGIDHTLGEFEPDFVVGVTSPTGPSVMEDDCSPVPIAGVNTMPLNTGLSAAQLRCGMLTSKSGGCRDDVPPGSAGGNNVPARLHLGPYVQSTYEFLEESMDNKPLWDFMSSPLGTWPSACSDLYNNRTTGSWDYFDKKDELIACLTAWTEGDGQLFDDGIIGDPRFAWLPYLAESNLNTEPSACPSSAAAKCVHFNDFAPVYMQTLYTVITGGSTAGACDDPLRTGVSSGQRWGRHDAGEELDCGDSNGNLDRLSAIVLDCGMLSSSVCNARPGFPPGGTVVPRLELTR